MTLLRLKMGARLGMHVAKDLDQGIKRLAALRWHAWFVPVIKQ